MQMCLGNAYWVAAFYCNLVSYAVSESNRNVPGYGEFPNVLGVTDFRLFRLTRANAKRNVHLLLRLTRWLQFTSPDVKYAKQAPRIG